MVVKPNLGVGELDPVFQCAKFFVFFAFIVSPAPDYHSIALYNDFIFAIERLPAFFQGTQGG
jgi:hypothetical protein